MLSIMKLLTLFFTCLDLKAISRRYYRMLKNTDTAFEACRNYIVVPQLI